MDLREKARELVLQNYEATGKKYICPSPPQYRDQWLWDSCFHAIICAELGLKDLAKNEIEKLLRWQRKDGWIPHQIYLSPKRRWCDFERLLYKKDHSRFHTSITQPAVLAQAVEAINDPEWNQEILPFLINFYVYFAKNQDPDGDNLISICHPCESGRDTSPEFDFFRWCIKNKSFRFLDVFGFHLQLYKMEWQYKKLGWDIQKIWQKDLFNIEDLMFHCIWVEGLRSLQRLIPGPRSLDIKNLADRAENAVYELSWDEKDKIFYSLNSKNQKIKRLTISNLFPLILDNIPTKMHQALVEHLTNPDEFWTPYPIPSIAKNDPEFDPGHGFYCNWRGPTWINMNWFIIRGLVKHGYYDVAEKITRKTWQMVEREGFREFYNPLTGKGLRNLTKNFGWSALVVTFPRILSGSTH